MEIDSNKSKSKSRLNMNVSEEISMSELDMLANRKKMKSENSVSIDVNSKSSKRSLHKTKSSSSLDNNSNIQRVKLNKVYKENNNESTRREKSEMLYKLTKLVTKHPEFFTKMSMDNTLDDIKNEYIRIRTNIDNESNVKFWKKMLLMGVQGIEKLNTTFDPLGVDLDGWSESMGYSMEEEDYDEVLTQLYEKYKGSSSMSPEIKLILMIIGSAGTFAVTKKISNLGESGFSNILNQFSRNFQPEKPQQQFQQPPQFQQQPQQFQSFIPNANDLQSENSDIYPSKMNGPHTNFDSPDTLNIEEIIKKMNDNELKKQKSEESEKIIQKPKAKPGRPKKQPVKKRN